MHRFFFKENLMAERKKESSEIYADFTMSRIDPAVRDTMSVTQLNAVREALLANQPYKQHALDLRGTIPLFFANFYFVLLAGQDKRKKTLEDQEHRSFKRNLTLGYVLSLIFMTFAVAMVWGAILLLLYWVKRELGIDIFPSMHFLNFFQSD